MMRLDARSILLALAFSLVGCATASPGSPAAAGASAQGGSLYQRLGGKAGIDAVVDTFVLNVGRDPRIQLRFLFTDLDSLRGHLSAQLCEATGGPCKYTGKAMKPGHAGMHIKDAEFDAMAEDLVAALSSNGVGAPEQKELLAAVGAMRGDIVESGAP